MASRNEKGGFLGVLRREVIDRVETLAGKAKNQVGILAGEVRYKAFLALDGAVMSLLDFHERLVNEAIGKSAADAFEKNDDAYVQLIAREVFETFKTYVRLNPKRKSGVIHEFLCVEFACFVQRADNGEEPFKEILNGMKGAMTVLRYERDAAKCFQSLKTLIVKKFGS